MNEDYVIATQAQEIVEAARSEIEDEMAGMTPKDMLHIIFALFRSGGGISKVSKHAKGRHKSPSYREKRKAKQKISKMSRKRNRGR